MSGDYAFLIDRLIRGQVSDEDLLNELDDLLRWLGGTECDASRAIQKALQTSGISALEFRKILLLRIDQTLFRDESHPYRILGLRSDASLEQKKTRYHRLLKVFHPDRAVDDEQWVTRRAELINTAFDKARMADFLQPIPLTQASTAAWPESDLSAETGREYNPHFRSPLRGRIGLSGIQFRNRVIIGLVLVSMLFIGSLLVDYKFSHVPTPVRVAEVTDKISAPVRTTPQEAVADQEIVETSSVQQESLAVPPRKLRGESASSSQLQLAEAVPLATAEAIPALDAPDFGPPDRFTASSLGDASRPVESEPATGSSSNLSMPEEPSRQPLVSAKQEDTPVAKADSRKHSEGSGEKLSDIGPSTMDQVAARQPVTKRQKPKTENQPSEAAEKIKASAKEESTGKADPAANTKPRLLASKQADQALPKVRVQPAPKKESGKTARIQRKQVKKPDRPTPVTIEVVQAQKAEAKGIEITRGDDYWFSMWLMKAYVQAVEAGDLDFLERAFSPSVNVNGQQLDRDVALARYLQLFSETRKRRLDINVKRISYAQGKPGRLRIQGVETLYRYARDSAPHVTNNVVIFDVVKIGKGGEIAGISRN